MTWFDKVIPILRIFDEARARESFIDYLGFSVDRAHRFADNAPSYLSVPRTEP